LFTIMGAAIVLQTLMSIAVVVALWRQPFEDEALGWALRLGLSITIIGAMSGGLMTRPTDAQLELARATRRMVTVGAHTVGAPDGGPGLPATGWSREHGDLRVPHFLGLHAVQVLPLLAIFVRSRRWTEATRARVTVAAAAGYLLLFGVVLWQALRGQSVTAPDSVTIASLAAWFAFTAGASWIAAKRGGRVHAHAAAL
jgi:hypothetical protein